MINLIERQHQYPYKTIVSTNMSCYPGLTHTLITDNNYKQSREAVNTVSCMYPVSNLISVIFLKQETKRTPVNSVGKELHSWVTEEHYFSHDTVSYYVSQADLKFGILLPHQPPGLWDPGLPHCDQHTRAANRQSLNLHGLPDFSEG